MQPPSLLVVCDGDIAQGTALVDGAPQTQVVSPGNFAGGAEGSFALYRPSVRVLEHSHVA